MLLELIKYFGVFVWSAVPCLCFSVFQSSCKVEWIREKVQAVRTLCVYLNAHEHFNDCNSCKLQVDDSVSCLAWYFQEDAVTLATSLSHGTCFCMHSVSKSKAFPSGRNHTARQESKCYLLNNELWYLSPWYVENNFYLPWYFLAAILSKWQYVYYIDGKMVNYTSYYTKWINLQLNICLYHYILTGLKI